MKKVLSFIFIFILFISPTSALELDISSKNAILYNMDSEKVLYEKNADEKVPIASLTKIMSALVSIENIQDLDTRIILTKDDFKGLAEANAVTAGFTNGEVVTYRDLLYGLLLPSGADAAKALARNIAGSEENFIKMMNEKAVKMNLKNTHFSTVIGLDDTNNYSTAKEVALIFKEALKNEDFNKIIKAKEYTSSDGKVKFHSTIQRNAKKFEIDIPYILGGKTGTTTKAGLCLATIAKGNGTNYMLVTLGALYDKKAPHHIEDAKTIYDYFIQNYKNHLVVNKKVPFTEIKVKYGKEKKLKLYPSKNITLYLKNNYNKNDIKYIYNGEEEITSFTKKGKKIGTLEIYYKDDLIDKENIILTQNLQFNIFEFIKENIIILSIVIAIVIIAIFIKRKNKITS